MGSPQPNPQLRLLRPRRQERSDDLRVALFCRMHQWRPASARGVLRRGLELSCSGPAEVSEDAIMLQLEVRDTQLEHKRVRKR